MDASLFFSVISILVYISLFLTVAGCFGGCRGRSMVPVKGARAGQRGGRWAGRAGDRREQSGCGKRTGNRATAGWGLVLSRRQGTRRTTLITQRLLHTENIQFVIYSVLFTEHIFSIVYWYIDFSIWACLSTPVSPRLCVCPRRLVQPDLPPARQERPPRCRWTRPPKSRRPPGCLCSECGWWLLRERRVRPRSELRNHTMPSQSALCQRESERDRARERQRRGAMMCHFENDVFNWIQHCDLHYCGKPAEGGSFQPMTFFPPFFFFFVSWVAQHVQTNLPIILSVCFVLGVFSRNIKVCVIREFLQL